MSQNGRWYLASSKNAWRHLDDELLLYGSPTSKENPHRFQAVCGRRILSIEPGLPPEQVSSADRCPGCMRREASEGCSG